PAVGVRVLRLEMSDDLGGILLSEPLVPVLEGVTVMCAGVGAAGCDGGVGHRSTLAQDELTGAGQGARIYRGRLTEVKPTVNSSFMTPITSAALFQSHNRKRTVETAALIVVLVIALALFFDFTYGIHDTANAMATPIATGALKPKTAVLLAAGLNLVGAFLSTEVSKTVSGGIINESAIGHI